MNNNLKISSALQWAWKRSAAVMLCMVLVFFGCKEDKDAQKMDEESFVKSLESVPVVLVPKSELSVWLQGRIEFYENGGVYGAPTSALFYRGTSNGRVVYYIRVIGTSCPMCHFFHENGENMVWTLENGGVECEKFLATCKNWVVFYETGNYPWQKTTSKSSFSDIERISVVDKFEFPDISHLNDWLSEDIIPRRFKALQIPDNVLANISTAGLLETCLDFPYLIDIFHSNGYGYTKPINACN